LIRPGVAIAITTVSPAPQTRTRTRASFGPIFAVSTDVDSPYAPGQDVGIGFPERGPVLIAD